MDCAASEFYDEAGKQYDLNNKQPGQPNYVNKRRRKRFFQCFVVFFSLVNQSTIGFLLS